MWDWSEISGEVGASEEIGSSEKKGNLVSHRKLRQS